MDFFQFSLPTKVVFNVGLAKDFSAELDRIPANKYFIVTDKIISDLKIIDPIIEGIKNSGREVVGVFTEVPSDSGIKVIEKVAQQAKESGAEAIIAVGGGSVLDTAKGANILFSLGGDLVQDYSGAQTITEDLCPLIAIPTTAGTGSEVTEAIVVLDEATHTKLSFVDSHMLPTLTILDPELTLALPPKITAATAIDALTHSIEAIMSVQRGPVSDALALQAIRMIFQNIKTAVKDGSDIEARSELLVAATLAGIAFNHAMVGVVHAVAHTIGALFRVHHGMANGIFLPYGMEYNLDIRVKEIASMASSMGIKISSDEHQTALACIQAVKDLKKELNSLCQLPATLKDVNIKREDLEQISQKAPEDGASFYNPREINSEDLYPYLEKAFEGK
jgi:alcohol dehydrogenase